MLIERISPEALTEPIVRRTVKCYYTFPSPFLTDEPPLLLRQDSSFVIDLYSAIINTRIFNCNFVVHLGLGSVSILTKLDAIEVLTRASLGISCVINRWF